MSENKRYYWLKLKENFFDDDTMDFLESQENGKEYLIFYLKLCCKSLKDEGKLIRYVGNTVIPYDDVTLAKITRTNIDVVRNAVALFYQIGLIEKLDTGELYLSQINEMIGSECDSAQRVRKLRAKNNLLQEKALQESYIVTDKRYKVTENRYNVKECNTESRDRVRERDKNLEDGQTATSLQSFSENNSITFYSCEELEKMGKDIEDVSDKFDDDLINNKKQNDFIKNIARQGGYTGVPHPKEVYAFWRANQLAISPERFWELNNNKKWLINGVPIKHWEKAYAEMTPTFDEKFDPTLKFDSSHYDGYTGEIESVGTEY